MGLSKAKIPLKERAELGEATASVNGTHCVNGSEPRVTADFLGWLDRQQGRQYELYAARKPGFRKDTLHTLNFGVFSQMLIMPLLHRHRILTQVAGYHTDAIKFPPPVIVTRDDIDYFLSAMQQVLEDVQRVPGNVWKRFTGLAKGAWRA